MFFSNLLPLETPIMEAFIKVKVREIAGIFFKENENGFIPKTEVPYLVRYFLQYPSQTQVVDEIIPEVEKLETDIDRSGEVVQIEAFEKQLILILKNNMYPSYEKELLMECFRLLDANKVGYIDLHTFYTFIKSYGVTFSKDQIQEMEKFLLENETDFLEPAKIDKDTLTKKKHTQFTTRKFYYESYVRKVVMDNKKHYDHLMADFKMFMDIYKQEKENQKQTNV
jgi:Ca2+-binding EF-hand superfamily protein